MACVCLCETVGYDLNKLEWRLEQVSQLHKAAACNYSRHNVLTLYTALLPSPLLHKLAILSFLLFPASLCLTSPPHLVD